ncbi:MAG: CoA-binding protein [Candidatus Woesearchaeota archaeon]
MTIENMIDKKFVYAVAGVSTDSDKYGHQVFKDLLTGGFTVYPLNPKAEEVLGRKVYGKLDELPEQIDVLIIVTPPPMTDKLVREAISKGVKKIWMQPGSFTQETIECCTDNDVEFIAGACIMTERK